MKPQLLATYKSRTLILWWSNISQKSKHFS